MNSYIRSYHGNKEVTSRTVYRIYSPDWLHGTVTTDMRTQVLNTKPTSMWVFYNFKKYASVSVRITFKANQTFGLTGPKTSQTEPKLARLKSFLLCKSCD